MVRVRKILGKLLKWGFVLLMLLSAILLTLQWWGPSLLPWIARQAGVEIGAVHYAGRGVMQINQIHYQSDSLSLQVENSEVLLPTWWFWWGWRDLLTDRTVIRIDSWTLAIQSSAPEPEPETTAPPDLPAMLKQVTDWWHLGRRWLPNAQLTEGTIHMLDQTVRIPSIQKSGVQLEASLVWQDQPFTPILPNDLSLQFSLVSRNQDPPLVIHWMLPELSTNGSIEFLPNFQQQQLRARCTIEAGTGKARIESLWIPGSWLPETASAQIQSLNLNPSRYITDAPAGELQFSANAEWQQGIYDLSVQFHNQNSLHIQNSEQTIQQLSGSFSASGNSESLRLDTLQLKTDGVVLNLSEPVQFQLSPFAPTNSTSLQLNVNLEQQSWLSATGILAASVVITEVQQSLFKGTFSLTGQSLQVDSWALDSIHFDGVFDQDSLSLSNSWVRISSDNELHIRQAGFSWKEQQVFPTELTLKIDSTFRDRLTEYVPALPKWDSLALHWQLQGGLEQLQHQGIVEVHALDIPDWPIIHGKLELSGKNTRYLSLDANLHTENQFQLVAKGSIQHDNDSIGTEDFLIEIRDSQQNLAIWHSGNLRFSPSPLHPSDDDTSLIVFSDMRLELSHDQQTTSKIEWSGELQPNSLAQGSLQLNGFFDSLFWLSNLSPVVPDLSAYFAENIQADLQWNNSPLSGHLAWALGYRGSEQHTWVSSGKIQWEDQQTNILPLVIGLRESAAPTLTRPLLRLQAELPLQVYPHATNSPVDWQERSPWQVQLLSITDEAWLSRQMEDLPFSATSPQFQFVLSGTPFEPAGFLKVSSPQIHLQETLLPGARAIDIREIHLDAEITSEEIRLNPSGLQLAGTPVQLQATLPIRKGDFSRWIQGESQPDLNSLAANLQLDPLSLESLNALLPDMLRAQGMVTLSLDKKANQAPTGTVHLSNIATMPMGSLGTLDNIHAEIHFNETAATLKKGGLSIGGLSVLMEGDAHFADQNNPLFNLKIKGENIPFVRSPGLILRADLNVEVSNKIPQEPPQIQGNLVLRDSILLMDLTQFRPSPQSPSQRPPFFSVDSAPFKDWKLNLGITGNRFLNIRNPLLDGILSTQMTLIGTLEEPQIVGSATLHDARIKFPFARFQVAQGTVLLDRINPYDPRLSIQATSETLGYNLQLGLSGFASNPELTFSSTPPLESSQILLLVTTGQPPSGEINRSTASRLGTLGLYLGSGVLGDSGNDDTLLSRITMESGQRVSEKGKETMQLQYRINDRLYLIGEYDEFDAYNMDFKWKFFSK